MSIYSTISLTRAQALELINKKKPEDLTNNQLQDILFILYAEITWNNFGITEDPNGITYELNKERFEEGAEWLPLVHDKYGKDW